jgi:hypothetical protein
MRLPMLRASPPHDVVVPIDVHHQHPAATESQFIEQIAKRHRKRQSAIHSAQGRQNQRQNSPSPITYFAIFLWVIFSDFLHIA